MIKQLLASSAMVAELLSLAACSGEGEVGVSYSEPGPAYVQPGPPVGFYEGNVYYDNFDTYWHHHPDWDRNYAYREWQQHPREPRREEHREHEYHEHEH